MAIKKIKKGIWQRQIHIANATIRAGFGWSGDQLRTIGVSAEERADLRSRLLQQQAESWVNDVGKLKGSIVKIGQILATYGEYCLPKPLADALHQFEAETEPLSWKVIQPHIHDSLKNNYRDLSIHHEALAAASLSQVHRATVNHDKRELCLKVLYPGITETLDSDFALIENGLGFWLGKVEKVNFLYWMQSIRSVLNEEIDLEIEAKKLRRWKKILTDDIRYIVPEVAEEFSSARLLAMSYESGVVQHDRTVLALSQERRNNLARNMLELFLNELLVFGEMQTDPHPGNYRIVIDGKNVDKIVLLDFGSVRKIDVNLLHSLRKILIGAYNNDLKSLEEGLFESGIMEPDISAESKKDFLDIISGLIEPINYKKKISLDSSSVPAYAIDEKMMYCWGDAGLPKRLAKQAMLSAFSKNFKFPSAEFLLLSRKLAGVYAFIATLDARFDGSEIFEEIIKKKPFFDKY
jgi:predicted unusual protein kinase regulating ubiquinone biosynthesis (AarF/ABC1/UbiB family)